MDFYIVLGLERGATLGDIKRAYKRLARRFHPDINPGDRMAAAQFRQIAEAYETLSDPDRRRRYDTGRSRGRAGEPSRRSGSKASTSRSASAARRRRPSAISSPTCCSSATARRDEGAPERGADLHQAISLDFEEAMRGGQRDADRHAAGALPRRAAAPAGCTSPRRRCAQCHGAGVVKSARGHMVFSKPCAQCGGTGRQRQTRVPGVRRRSRSRCGPSR